MSITSRSKSRSNQQRISQKNRRLAHRRRLLLEPLESRDLLAVITWSAGGDATTWSNANNWDLARVPITGDDVVIPDVGATSQVVYGAAAGSVSVNSLISDEPLSVTGGALLVTNATTLNAGVTLSDGQEIRMHGDLTLHGTGTLGTNSKLVFDSSPPGSQTFNGTGTLVFAAITDASPSRIVVNGGRQLSIGSGLTISVPGHGNVGGQIPFTGGNVLINDAPISLGSGSSFKFAADTTINHADITVAGGVLRLNNLFAINSVNVLTNTGNIDVTNGSLIASGHTNNSGTISLSGSALTLNEDWSNLGGTITATNTAVQLGGTFTTADIGTFTRTGGFAVLNGNWDNTGGLVNLDGTLGTLSFEAATITGGTISGSSSNLTFSTSNTNRLNGVTLNTNMDLSANDSKVRVRDGLTLNGTATLGLRGWMIFDSPAGESQTLGGSGEVVFTSPVSGLANQSRIAVDANTQLTIGPDMTILGDGWGNIGGQFVNGGNTVTNEGTIIQRSNGATLRIPPDVFTNNGVIEARDGGVIDVIPAESPFVTNFSGGTLTGGTWRVFANSLLNLGSSQPGAGTTNITTNAATILLDGPNSRLENGGGAETLLNLAANAAAGDLTISNGRNFTATGNLTNAGSVTVGAASTLTASTSYTQTAGSTTLDSGTLVASGGVDIQGGVLDGEGTVDGNVNHAGIVIPGPAAGTIAITGNETVANGGSVQIEIGGLTAGTEHDQLLVGGVATFDGTSSTLDLSLIGGFTPSLGNTFQIMTYGSHVGEFTTVNGTSLGGCLAFNLVYNATDLTLEVVSAGGVDITSLSAAGISEGGTATLDGSFTSGNPALSHDVTIDWGDGTPLTMFTLAPGVLSFSQPHPYADDPAGLPDDYTINVTISSATCGSDADSTTVTVVNEAPMISSVVLSASAINEGQSVVVTGSFSDAALGVPTETFTGTALWSDGVTTVVVVDGVTGQFSTSRDFPDDNPSGTSSDDYTVAITINDDDNGSDTEVSGVLTVSNLAPSIDAIAVTASQASKARVGDIVTVSGNFSDLGVEDTHAVTVTWDDGTTSPATVDQLAGTFTADHVYTTGGIFAINVTLTDDDTGTAMSATTAFVTGVRVTGTGELQIVGSAGRDVVDVRTGSGGSVIKVKTRFDQHGVDERAEFTFSAVAVQSIYVILCNGNDDGHIHSDIMVPAFMDGGAGDDRLRSGGGNDTLVGGDGDDDLDGGAGDDILLGGDGDDDLKGDSGFDILIGGFGADKLNGQDDDDILIGGLVTLDYAMLNDVRNIWTNGNSYNSRVAALTGSGGLLEANVTVLDDGVGDKLKGGPGYDLFFADLDGSDEDSVDDKWYENIFSLL